MDALLLLKASLILLATLLVQRLLRRAPAVARHRIWSGVFAALLALPVLAAGLPALYVPLPARWDAAGIPDVRSASIDPAASLEGAENPSVASGSSRTIAVLQPLLAAHEPQSTSARAAAGLTGQGYGSFDQIWPVAATLLLTVWVTGAAAATIALLLSLLRVRRLTRAADNVCDPAWRSAADAIGARLGLRFPVRLLLSPDIATPMAGGVWRPAIFLPASARAWSAERRDVVLAHEIAHLAELDPLRHLVARLVLAGYWFHPLAWIAAREGAVAREQACDEAVLALGTRPSVYARVLLELAESIGPPAAAVAALPIVQRSLLETRLMAILNDDVRPMTRRLLLIPASGLALLTLTLAAAQPSVSALSPDIATPAAATALGPTGTTTPAVVPELAPRVRAAFTAVVQGAAGRDSACWSDSTNGSFSGTMSSRDAGGRTEIFEQVGTRGSDRVIQKTFGDLRLCMVAEGLGARDTPGKPSEWIGRASRVVLEARRGGAVQRMEFGSSAAGGAPSSWVVAGVPRAVDDAARQWRDRMLAALDSTWEISALRGEVSSLHGQISSIHGQRSSLQGEISSLQGEVSSMQGRISSIHGEESSLHGRISSIQGQVSSLQGAISSAQGAISSLNAGGYRADADRARIAQHQAEIARLEREIRDFDAGARIAAVERDIAAMNPDGKTSAIESEIRAFNLDGKVAAIQGRIAALDVDGQVAGIQRRIAAALSGDGPGHRTRPHSSCKRARVEPGRGRGRR